MGKLTAEEYSAIKKQRNVSIRDIAHTMKRSVAVVTKIKNTKNYEEYRQLVKAEHIPSKKRRETLGAKVTRLENEVRELREVVAILRPKKGWFK